ncbi:MAG TPA: hypothetical protein VMM76_08085 [Pirellulaceae bacterium]|nr:hypothetical protein [Pirellulaceae bacterium]
MYKFFSVLLVAFAVSTSAHADTFGFLSSSGGPEQIINGYGDTSVQSTVGDGAMHGYPFYSGCCEQKSSCCEGLWEGYCGSKGCGMRPPRIRHHGHHGGMKGGCGCGAGVAMGYGHGSWGKGGCGYAAPCGGGKSGRAHLSYRGLGGKGGDLCDPCAPKQCRLGLFDWMHFGGGHACGVCGGAGCSSCAGGKGGFSKGGFSKGGFSKGGYGTGGYMDYAPVPGYGESYYGTPTDAYEESTLQPPEVLVEPTSISDRSAWRRPVPTNPFARPLGY